MMRRRVDHSPRRFRVWRWAGLLLGGAALTLLSAWLVGGTRIGPLKGPHPVQPTIVLGDPDHVKLVFANRRAWGAELCWSPDDGYRIEGDEYVVLTWSDAPAWMRRAVRRTPGTDWIYIAVGWPMLVFEMTAHDVDPEVWKFDYEPHGGIGFRYDFGSRFVTAVWPTTPIWPGVAVNAAVWTAVLWSVLCGPGTARRALRRRRGLCLRCGYPVGVSPVCTECGAAVPAQAGARP